MISLTISTSNTSRVKRIVGGVDVDCGSQIRVVSLRDNSSRHLCGAVLVTKEVALTAAHCVQTPYQYVLQLSNLCDITPPASVLEVIKHPDYDKYTRAHDIAVLRINLDTHNITWTDDILPDTSFGLSGECIAYGYGSTDSNTKILPNRLKAARLKIISLDDCTDILGFYLAPRFDYGMLCALGDGEDTCQGDSGGPLMCSGKLQGISSYGLSCGILLVPGVYTSIGMHLPWIYHTMEFITRDTTKLNRTL
ncbi:PREDICTED: trypsin-2 [Papilio polytes]|uniref:trypsin-2 n=1 Tax=Papilio polytes TaxID=76194 RepID=UPI00067691F2|nr:PREDICTED: trypsin-2 [Papilio polytes]